MSHHGNDDEVRRHMKETMAQIFGEFPDGKLNDKDQGAIAIAVGEGKGRVILRFPKPVDWVGMTPDEAADLGTALIQYARNIGITKPLTIEL